MLKFSVWKDGPERDQVLINPAFVVSVQTSERRESYAYTRVAIIRTSDGKEVVVCDNARVVGKAIEDALAKATEV